jgi:hypothetical protein
MIATTRSEQPAVAEAGTPAPRPAPPADPRAALAEIASALDAADACISRLQSLAGQAEAARRRAMAIAI